MVDSSKRSLQPPCPRATVARKLIGTAVTRPHRGPLFHVADLAEKRNAFKRLFLFNDGYFVFPRDLARVKRLLAVFVLMRVLSDSFVLILSPR